MLRISVTLLSVALCTATAAADSADDAVNGIAVPIVGGTVKLDLRARYEHADADGLAPSNAQTLRTRLGYGTQPWEGLSAYVEMENISAADHDSFFDALPPNLDDRTPIADPSDTELNQAYAMIDRPDFGRTKVIGGRQRIVLDDHRFIGNVGWRQNEQTYDSAWAQSGFWTDGLTAGYGYIWDVNRIFGDQGPPATRDYESNSHLARAAYDVAPWFQPVAFVYLLDLRQAPAESSNTYGLRATGTAPLGENWSLAYQASYAFQTDGGTSGGNNPVDYRAHYALGDLSIGFRPIGSVGGGFELLGSDHGDARFATPLATLHKFNGWADVFLNNGGVNGLQDAYAYVSPALPWKLNAQVIYHQFWSDEHGHDMGSEIDAVLSRKFGAYVTVLAKAAWYEDGGVFSPRDTTRYWLETTVAF
jgi:Alginate export